jgi:geranylgeranyl diphosphate synthase type II
MRTPHQRARKNCQAPSDDITELVSSIRTQVDARLEQLCPQQHSGSNLLDAMRYSLLSPGKRLRAITTLVACRQCAGDLNSAIDLACAVEMVHAASLVVDDLPCMDHARLRRGKPTTHLLFGEDIAVLAAISMLNEAYHVIVTSDRLDNSTKTLAMGSLTSAIGVNGLALGQEHDLSSEGGQMIEDIERRHLHKTGALFSAAAALGGAAAKVDREHIELLREFGAKLGTAYQMLDDVADKSSAESESGKDADQDRFKITALTLLGAEGARLSASRLIENAMNCASKIDYGAGQGLIELARMVESKFSNSQKSPSSVTRAG